MHQTDGVEMSPIKAQVGYKIIYRWFFEESVSVQAGRKAKFCQRIYFEKKKLKEALEPKQSGHSFFFVINM